VRTEESAPTISEQDAKALNKKERNKEEKHKGK
jgi:hypothetical protein